MNLTIRTFRGFRQIGKVEAEAVINPIDPKWINLSFPPNDRSQTPQNTLIERKHLPKFRLIPGIRHSLDHTLDIITLRRG
jgi:hypothetical protein